MSNSKSQKESILYIKKRSIWFFQKYVKSRKACLKSDIKAVLPPKYSKIRQKLYYGTKKEGRRVEKDFIINTIFSQPFRSCQY